MKIAGCKKLRIGVERVLVALGFALPRGERGHVAAAASNTEHVQETVAAGAGRIVVVVVNGAEADAGRGAEGGLLDHPHRVGLAIDRAGNGVHQHVVPQVEPAHAGVLDAHSGAIAGDGFGAEHVNAVEIHLLPWAAKQPDADRVEVEAREVVKTVGAQPPNSVVDDGVAEVVGERRKIDAKRPPPSRIVVLDIVHLVAGDTGVIAGIANLDAGHIVIYRRGDLVKDLVLRNDGSYGADQFDASERHVIARAHAADRIVINVQAFVNAIERGRAGDGTHGDAFVSRVDLVVLDGQEIVITAVCIYRGAAGENAEDAGGGASSATAGAYVTVLDRVKSCAGIGALAGQPDGCCVGCAVSILNGQVAR
ncbi:MAG: hypothetical protein DMF24_11700 [Verrucomicrobia bacterium]|nr:MAG: hypothetical protein DMF24_11700 [Verrucomicrobiota bacterium]